MAKAFYKTALELGMKPEDGDELVFAVCNDERAGENRCVAMIAVVCGAEPGVLLALSTMSKDGTSAQKLGVSSEQQARVIVQALHKTWPGAFLTESME